MSRCSVEGLTNDCKIFSESDKERITFRNGTSVLNLFALSKKKASDESFKALDDELRQKIQTAQILDEIPESLMSSRFKMALLSDPRTLREAFLRDPLSPMTLPWPPNQARAETRSVSPKELRSLTGTLFSAEQLKKLKSINKFQDLVSGDPEKLELLDSQSKISEQRLRELQDLIEFVRGEIVDRILDGRNEETISQEEKALIKKIRLIQYINPTDPSATQSAPCQGVVGNAFYIPLTHAFTICSNIVNHPDATLVQIIAHEFTHAIDPCIFQNELLKINHIKIRQISDQQKNEKARIAFELKRPSEATILYLISALPPKVERTNFDFSLIDQKSEGLKWLIEQGVFNRETTGAEFSKYPFANQYSCLLGAKKKFYARTDAELEKLADEIVTAKSEQYDKSYSASEDRTTIVKALKTKPECASAEGSKEHRNAQGQEVMSDWMSAHVLGQYLKKNPPITDNDRLASIAMFASLACFEAKKIEEFQKDSKTSARLQIVSAIEDLSHRNKDSHPEFLQRLNEIILMEPEVRKALGCATQPAACFSKESLSQSTDQSKTKISH